MSIGVGEPRMATIGLVDGTSRTGLVQPFDPAAPELRAEIYSRAEDAPLGVVGLTVPTDTIAYLAFHRGARPWGPPRDRELVEVRVHVAEREPFAVVVARDDLAAGQGYWGFPISRSMPYERIWFFAARVQAVEDATPLGQLLVQRGFVDPEDLARGAAVQQDERSSRLGTILVDQKVLEPQQVEEAARRQGQQQTNQRQRLGEILVDAGLASPEQLKQALELQQQRRGRRLGQLLVELGSAREADIARTLAEKFHLPFVDLEDLPPEPSLTRLVPRGLAEQLGVVPLRDEGDHVVVGVADPTAVEALDLLRFRANRRFKQAVVLPSQLERRLHELYPETAPDPGADLEAMVDQLMAEEAAGTQQTLSIGPELAELGSVSRIVYRMLITAHARGASDIHVEPYGPRDPVRVRQRVDGRCELQTTVPPALRKALVARIKILADLDITEKRLPQDGKIRLRLPDRPLELRVATLPTVDENEDVVLRLLAASGALPIDKLGLSERNLRECQRMVARPYGLLLVVGPTGSGKTTTLHSLLDNINDDERKIWTAEDPVEITQKGLRQVQINKRIDMDFARVMRAFLRADPDVIMVGEMRDRETAATGVEASLTGHLVMSTLHTNSAPETITRMLDMGLDALTFADALLGVLAQRLARRLCSNCKVDYEPSEAELGELRQLYGADCDADGLLDGSPRLWRAEGCERCGGDGYKGRVGLHELLVNDAVVARAVHSGAKVEEIREAAQAGGMRTLLQDGIAKALRGDTDLRQVLAVCSA